MHTNTQTEVQAAAVILLTMRGKMPKRGEVVGEKSTTLQDRTKRSLRTQMKKQK
ncbi:hypothetical protein [Bacillus subtilis]|uniref:hypothetical protein n=1 Tax=Bacillus subtilis TaxID=1423 RepID=UPI00201D1EBF|nr:hypothetical protein [Bacillus subtilis]